MGAAVQEYERKSKELIKEYKNLPYEQKRKEYKNYLRKEFELYLECAEKLSDSREYLKDLFELHLENEKKIYEILNHCIIF